MFEFAGRGISATSNPPHHIDIYHAFGLRDGFKTITLALATTGVGFTQLDGSGQNWIPGGVLFASGSYSPTVDHTYRVEKHMPEGETAQVLLFVDDVQVVNLAYSALPANTENRALMFTSLQGTSDTYIEYFRYRIGTTSLRTGPNCDADIDNNGSVGT